MDQNSDKKRKKIKYCSVPHCKIEPNVSAHKFPRDPAMREKWTAACGIKKKVTDYTFVCNAHFLKTDFIPRWDGKPKRLKSIAIPSQNLPDLLNENAVFKAKTQRNHSSEVPVPSNEVVIKSDHVTTSDVPMTEGELSNKRKEQPVNLEIKTNETVLRDNKQIKLIKLNLDELKSKFNITCNCSPENDSNVKNVDCYEVKAAKILLELNEKVSLMIENNEIIFSTKDLILKRAEDFYLATRKCRKASFLTFLKNDQQLQVFTGIDFPLLHNLRQAASIREKDASNQFGISIEERIVLCLIKIRLDLTFYSIANLFYIPEQKCKAIFSATLQTLKAILKSAIYWPTKDEILKSMPESCENFKKTSLVEDSVQISVEKPICSRCRLLIASNYTAGENLKILLGFASCGLVTYVGKVQSGRAAMETITDENYIAKVLVPSCDAIMTDGFLIEEECNKVFVELIKVDTERKSCLEIARQAKVHSVAENPVENAVKRIKKFKILQSKFPIEMVPLIDDINVVICGIVNLYNPIFIAKKV